MLKGRNSVTLEREGGTSLLRFLNFTNIVWILKDNM